MPAMSGAVLDWTPGRGSSVSAWMGLWELSVWPVGAGGWEFNVVNQMGDRLTGRRLSRELAIADCHELAERLAGKEE